MRENSFDPRFSRLFGWLPPHVPDLLNPREKLFELARSLYDKDRSAASDVGLNPGLPAAYAFIAQFVAHDLSFDPSTPGTIAAADAAPANIRTPRLDLDVLYGGDPDLNLHLYELDDQGKNTYRFRFGSTKGPLRYDLPRDRGLALIPDQRSDQHVIISQFHVALLKLHNLMLKQVLGRRRKAGRPDFFKAQSFTRWRYQYAVVHDLLPRLLGRQQTRTLLEPGLERWRERIAAMSDPPTSRAAVPLEFSVAVFRVAHSAIRAMYKINERLPPLPLFPPPRPGGTGATRADAAAAAESIGVMPGSAAAPSGTRSKGAPTSLFGGKPLDERLVVSWEHMFLVSGREKLVQLSRAFGPRLPMFFSEIPGLEASAGLAGRDLERGWLLGLPSGQDVAYRLGIENEFSGANDPLWYYAMLEVPKGGLQVGPVAAQILCKVFLDLLHLDPGCYLACRPTWHPTYREDRANSFRHIVEDAGMPFA